MERAAALVIVAHTTFIFLPRLAAKVLLMWREQFQHDGDYFTVEKNVGKVHLVVLSILV